MNHTILVNLFVSLVFFSSWSFSMEPPVAQAMPQVFTPEYLFRTDFGRSMGAANNMFLEALDFKKKGKIKEAQLQAFMAAQNGSLLAMNFLATEYQLLPELSAEWYILALQMHALNTKTGHKFFSQKLRELLPKLQKNSPTLRLAQATLEITDVLDSLDFTQLTTKILISVRDSLARHQGTKRLAFGERDTYRFDVKRLKVYAYYLLVVSTQSSVKLAGVQYLTKAEYLTVEEWWDLASVLKIYRALLNNTAIDEESPFFWQIKKHVLEPSKKIIDIEDDYLFKPQVAKELYDLCDLLPALPDVMICKGVLLAAHMVELHLSKEKRLSKAIQFFAMSNTDYGFERSGNLCVQLIRLTSNYSLLEVGIAFYNQIKDDRLRIKKVSMSEIPLAETKAELKRALDNLSEHRQNFFDDGDVLMVLGIGYYKYSILLNDLEKELTYLRRAEDLINLGVYLGTNSHNKLAAIKFRRQEVLEKLAEHRRQSSSNSHQQSEEKELEDEKREGENEADLNDSLKKKSEPHQVKTEKPAHSRTTFSDQPRTKERKQEKKLRATKRKKSASAHSNSRKPEASGTSNLGIQYYDDVIEADFRQMSRENAPKIRELLADIALKPWGLDGAGKPKKLRSGRYRGLYSRRITEEHRLVYDVIHNGIRIYSAKGHYKK